MKRQSGMSSEKWLQKMQKRPLGLFSDDLCQACSTGGAADGPSPPGSQEPWEEPDGALLPTWTPQGRPSDWGCEAEGPQSVRSPPPHRDPQSLLLPLPLCIQQCWAVGEALLKPVFQRVKEQACDDMVCWALTTRQPLPKHTAQGVRAPVLPILGGLPRPSLWSELASGP